MNTTVSIVLLAAGILLAIFGVRATESLSSDLSRFFTGTPTDKSIWMLIGGVTVALIGLGGLWLGARGS